ALIGAPMFFAVIWLSRYVSLGSLLGSAFTGGVVAVLVWLGYGAPATVVYAVGAVALIWLAHADNIGRLLRGEERKFGPRGRASV
ncbi:MAG: glycerol-3-phosphate acyltransferase, partial [Candidatus Limnocylindrales bacterium]